MKNRSVSAVIVLSMFMGLAFAAMVTQSASAACYDQSKQPIPCPKEKHPTATPYPTKTPLPTDTPTPQVAAAIVQVVTPDASQLAALCANLPAPGKSSNSVIPGNPGGNGPAGSQTGPGGGIGTPSGFTGPITFGLGGMLLGVLIGLLLPAVQRGFTGGVRGWNGPITQPGDSNWNGDGFPKLNGDGFPKLTSMGKDKLGDAGYEEIAQGGPSTGQGEAAAVDMFHKAAPSSKLGDMSIKKIDGGGFQKQGDAGFADGSVHNTGSSFAKSDDAGMHDISHDDAGITDGIS